LPAGVGKTIRLLEPTVTGAFVNVTQLVVPSDTFA
jgi:hypothetical protein